MHQYAARADRADPPRESDATRRFNNLETVRRISPQVQPREDAPDVESSDTNNRIRLMSKQRKERSEDNIFANNPFLEELLEWRDSPEGKQAMEISDVLRLLLKDVQVDAKGRKFIWRYAEQLDPVQRIQKQYPNFPSDRIEDYLLYWIETGYAPENYSRAQLDELDRLAAQWVADHMRPSKASKKGKRTPYS